MIEVDQQINAVRRGIGDRVLEAGEARVVSISQIYPTDADDLWDACTNFERIPRWFLPISGEPRLGGHYQLEGNASGTILSYDPPQSFTATWECGSNVSWIEVRITADGERQVRFELDHICHIDDHWQQFGPGAVGIGWELGIVGLTIHLSSGRRVDPAAGAKWTASQDGRRFIELSGQAWCAVNIAAGGDPDWARMPHRSAVGDSWRGGHHQARALAGRRPVTARLGRLAIWATRRGVSALRRRGPRS
jgi:uncharacterized protein YndB with AHSA1/START domain